MKTEKQWTVIKTKWGKICIEGNAQGVTDLKFSAKKNKASTQLSPALKKASTTLKDYFDGHKVSFQSLKVDQSSWTPFEKKVYQALRKVKPGKTVSYRDLAKAAGSPKAYRAVGSTMRKNRIPIIIPCHRVVGSQGDLCGFSAGLHWKKRLLSLEGASI